MVFLYIFALINIGLSFTLPSVFESLLLFYEIDLLFGSIFCVLGPGMNNM